jgi:hypothetical protein
LQKPHLKEKAMTRKFFFSAALFVACMAVFAGEASIGWGGESTDSRPAQSILAEMSDEQVRQMLLAELKKDALSQEISSNEPTLGGPSGPLAEILGSLEDESSESEDRFQQLWTGIPEIPHDLYKIFVSL